MGREEDIGAVEETFNTRAPDGRTVGLFRWTVSLVAWSRRLEDGTCVIVHVCGTHEVGAHVIRPLNRRGLGTVVGNTSSVVDNILIRKQWCSHCPVVRLVGPVRIGLIASVSSKASSKLEEAPVRNAVLIVITFVEREDLPSKSSSTILIVPSPDLLIEDCLRKR